ncbi:MAG: hypothetical protein ACRC8K_14410 [Waterburya sp.]
MKKINAVISDDLYDRLKQWGVEKYPKDSGDKFEITKTLIDLLEKSLDNRDSVEEVESRLQGRIDRLEREIDIIKLAISSRSA